jgi:signal transduction histidine kinase
VLEGWTERARRAGERGFEGLRVTGNTTWLSKARWADFLAYEEALHGAIGDRPALVLCTYDLRSHGGRDVLDLARAHDMSLVERGGRRTVLCRAGTHGDLRDGGLTRTMEAVGRLAGRLAHDFNNLLTVVGGYSDLLLARAGADAFQRSALEAIREAGRRGTALTAQLLALGQPRSAQPTPLDLRGMLGGLRERLVRLAGERIVLDLRPSLEPTIVRAEAGQLEQALLNLATNAREAMPCGGRLTIETGRCRLREALAADPAPVPPGDYVTLTVADSGVGITANLTEVVFEPFFTTKADRGSAGLGLSVVHGIVRRHGGHLTISSAVGEGTRVTLYLPEAAGEALPREPDADAAAGSGTVDAPSGVAP